MTTEKYCVKKFITMLRKNVKAWTSLSPIKKSMVKVIMEEGDKEVHGQSKCCQNYSNDIMVSKLTPSEAPCRKLFGSQPSLITLVLSCASCRMCMLAIGLLCYSNSKYRMAPVL